MTLLSDPKHLSDRAIDAALAEHLFGWTLKPGHWREPLYDHPEDAQGFTVSDLTPFASTGDGMLAVLGKVADFTPAQRFAFGEAICVKLGIGVWETHVAADHTYDLLARLTPRAVAEAAYQALLGEENA